MEGWQEVSKSAGCLCILEIGIGFNPSGNGKRCSCNMVSQDPEVEAALRRDAKRNEARVATLQDATNGEWLQNEHSSMLQPRWSWKVAELSKAQPDGN